MAAGGLTGTGNGSSMTRTTPPSSPGTGSTFSVSSKSTRQAQADGKKPGGKPEQRPAGGGQANSVGEQNQRLQEFDAFKGRPPVGERRQGDGQQGDQREGSFVGCAAGAAKDVVVDTVKGAYHAAKDAGGAALDQAGFEGYEGHTERTVDRGKAIWDGAKRTGEAVMSPIDTAGKIADAAKAEAAEIKSEIEQGDNCALGERVGMTVGTGATVVVPGGIVVKGGKVLAKMGGKDGPETKSEAKDVRDSGGEKRIVEGGIEYQVTTDKPGWGETRREVDSFHEAKSRRSESGDKGLEGEAKSLEDLKSHGVNIEDQGVDIEGLGRKEMRPPPQAHKILGEIDIETKHHVIDVHIGGKGKRQQMQRQLDSEQLNRGKDVILYSPGYSKHGTEFVDGVEVMKDITGPNGERARVVRDAGELAEIIKSSQ